MVLLLVLLVFRVIFEVKIIDLSNFDQNASDFGSHTHTHKKFSIMVSNWPPRKICKINFI